jgi:nitrilase
MRGGKLHRLPARPVDRRSRFQRAAILTADLDLRDIARGQIDFDVTGHYARPDVFHLQVNERAMTAVSNSIGAPPDPFAG